MLRNRIIAIITLIVVAGCGGGGSGGGGGLVSAPGRVQLPPGTNLALSSLQVFSSQSTSPVSADGRYTVAEPSASPAIIFLTDSAGKVILLGFSSTATGQGEISARTTAQILLFNALGAAFLPADQYTKALDLIAASTEATTLADTIAKRVAANPTALTTGDAQIDSTLQAAALSLVPGRAVQASRSSAADANPANPDPVSRVQLAVTRGREGGIGQILIQPTGLQSGAEVRHNPNGDGIVVVNNFRRRCQFFIFKTGTTDGNGNKNDFQTVEPIGGAHELPSVTKISGVFGTIADVLKGKVAYTEVKSEPVSLPLDPGMKETRYELVLVGFAARINPPPPPAVFSDPRYALSVPTLQNAEDDLAMDAFMREVLLNAIITQLMAPKDVLNVLGDKSLSSTLIEDLVKLFKSAPGVADRLREGKLVDALGAASIAIVNSSGFRKRTLLALLSDKRIAQFFKDIVNGDTLLKNIFGANTLLKGFELALSLGDIAKVTSDWANSHTAEVWSIKVEEPNVHISPTNATVTVKNNIVQLNVSVVGANVTDLRFAWSTTGTQGHLESATIPTPLPTGPIPDTQVDYVTDLLKLKTGQTDTVTVKVFIASDLTKPIGSATATITGGTDLACGAPPAGIVNGNAAPSVQLSKTSLHAGDILAVTIHIGANISGSWDIELFNNDARKPVIADILTLDGAPPPVGFVSSHNGAITIGNHVNPNGAAETHVVTFRMKTPLDLNGEPETQCAGGLTGGFIVGPLVIGDIFTSDAGSPSTTVFFNAGP